MALVVAQPMADGKVLHVAVAAFAQGPDVFQRGICHGHMLTAYPARHDAMQLACHRFVDFVARVGEGAHRCITVFNGVQAATA